ncbi:MAG: DUF4372 domain-containing protein [Chloroflexia bacterium]|nr:DUF4372 domain-containing protein [Chloroflexia bacterium]
MIRKHGHYKFRKNNKPLLRQRIDLIPEHILNDAIHRYQSDKHCSKYMTYDQLNSMMFGQLNKCLTLREIAQGISVSPKFLRDIKLEQSPARSTMSDGNEKRNYKKVSNHKLPAQEFIKGIFHQKNNFPQALTNQASGFPDKLIFLFCFLFLEMIIQQ